MLILEVQGRGGDGGGSDQSGRSGSGECLVDITGTIWTGQKHIRETQSEHMIRSSLAIYGISSYRLDGIKKISLAGKEKRSLD